MPSWRWFPPDPPAALLVGLTLSGAGLAQDGPERTAALIDALADPTTAASARAGLVEIGAPAVPDLLAALHEAEGTTEILRTLGAMRDAALPALPTLLAQLHDGSDRTTTLWALGQIGPYSPARQQISAAIPTALGRSARFFSYEVERARARLSVDPSASLTELEAELDEGNDHVWQFVAEILRQPRTDGDPVPLLLRILEERPTGPATGSSYTVRTAADSLVALIPDHPDAIPAYTVLLQSRDSERRIVAAMALGRQGALGAEALTPLIRMTSDPDPRVAGEAITALGMIGPAAARASARLRTLSEHDNAQIAQRAKVALRQIGMNREERS